MPISLANFIPKCFLELGNWDDRKFGDLLGEAGLSWLTWASRHFPGWGQPHFSPWILSSVVSPAQSISSLISRIIAPPTAPSPSPQHKRLTQVSSLTNKQTKSLSLALISSCQASGVPILLKNQSTDVWVWVWPQIHYDLGTDTENEWLEALIAFWWIENTATESNNKKQACILCII